MQDLAALGIRLATDQLKAGLRELERAQGVVNKTADAADNVGTVSEKAFKRTGESAKGAAREIVRFESQATGAFDRVKKGALDVGGSFDRLQRLALGGFAGGALAAGIISTVDAYTKFTSQLKLATQGQAEYAAALEKVRGIAQSAQADIGAIGTLYARISRNTAELGITQERVGKITESVALALKANGATGQEAASAMLQLSQAFGAGVLRGEEFNAINEAAPNLLKAVADQLGVNQGALKKMAEEGLITSQVLAIALPNALEKFREEAAKTQTIGGAFVNLRNEFTLLIGASAETSGAIGALAGSVNFLAENLETIINLAIAFGGIGLAAKIGTMTQAAINSTKATLALSAAQATLNGTTAAGAGVTALATRALGLLGGPIGVGITLLGAAATAWSMYSDSAETSSKKASDGAAGNANAVRLSTEEVIKYLDEQIKKYKELEIVAKKGSIKETVADQKNFVVEQIRLLQEENKFNGQTISSAAAKNEILARLGAQYGQLAAKASELDVAQKKAFSKEAEKLVEQYNTKFADAAGKAEAAVKAARAEFEKLGQSLPPELEKKIRDSFVKPSKDAENALKQAAKARVDFVESLRTEQKQLEASLSTQGKLSELDKDRIKAAEFFGGKIPKQVEQQLLLNETLRDEADLRKEIAEDEKKALETGDKRIADIIAQAEEIERQNRVYGLGKSQVEELIIAELERKKVGASPKIVAQLEREIEARKRLAGALATDEALDAQRKAKEDAKREIDRITDDIGKSVAEKLLQGGEEGTKKLGEYMKRYFLQLVIRTQIEPVFKQAAGQILGGAGGGFGGGASIAGAIGSFSALSSGGELGLILNQGFKMAGNFAQSAYAFTQTGQQFAGLAAGFGKLAPYAGSIAAVLSGDLRGGAGSAIGTALGSSFGPLGAAIGGAIGGKLLGGLGGGGKVSATRLGPEFAESITKPVTKQYEEIAKSLGAVNSQIKFAADGNTGRQGVNPNYALAALMGNQTLFWTGETALNEASLNVNSLRAVFAALKETNFASNVNAFFDTVNVASASFEELTASLQTAQLLKFVNDEFRAMGGALATLADQSVETLTQFFAMNGGIEGLSAGLNAFYDAFYTEQEKTTRLTNQLTAAFAGFNRPLPQTRMELRALVDSLDLRNTADQQLYATILQLTPALNQLLPAFDGVADSVSNLLGQITDQATQAVDKQIGLSQRAANEARDAARAFFDLAKSLRTVADEIFTQALGGDTVASLAEAFQATFARAITGDRGALGALGGQAQTLVGSIGQNAVSRVDFIRQTALIRNQVEQAAKVSDALGVGADYQAKIFDVQTAILETLKEELESGGINAQRLQEIKTALENVQGAINFAASLTVDQLLGVQGQLLGQTSITQIVAAATEGSEALLNAVLNRLSAQDTGTESIVAQLQKGNAEIGGYLAEIATFFRQQQDAENARRAAEAAEAKRVQDLAAAQNALKAIAEKQSAASSEVARAAAAINPLAGQFGVTLRDSAGGQADFGVSGGQFVADFNDILYNVGNEAGVRNFKNTFYGSGGLYDQTYGRAGELQGYLTELEAQRNLIRSLGGVPQFYNGGMHSGGMRIVGERGPELELTGAARYWNSTQTRMMMNGGMDYAGMMSEMRAMRNELALLRDSNERGQYAIAKNTGNIERRLERWDDGDRLRISVDQEAGETVNVTVI